MAVKYEVQGDVALVSLDRPEVFNAIDSKLSKGILGSLESATSEARALVLTGSGKAFCSGADLADLMEDYKTGGPDLSRLLDERFNPLIQALVDIPIPTVAAVNGLAAGAGMGLAFACDGRVMSDVAYFMSAFVNVALIPDSGTSWFLPQFVGLGRALEIATSGRHVPAEEALRIGLAHRVTAPEDVVSEAIEWAGHLADGPGQALVSTRKLMQGASAMSLSEALATEQRVQGMLGLRPDHIEGVGAFVEKRTPDFRRPARD